MPIKKLSKSGSPGKKMSRSKYPGGGGQPVQAGKTEDAGGQQQHGILEGISSLHSWIKTQTMIRPTKLGKKKDDMSFDDVSSSGPPCSGGR